MKEGRFESTLKNLYEIGRSSGWQMKKDLEEVLLDEPVEEEDAEVHGRRVNLGQHQGRMI